MISREDKTDRYKKSQEIFDTVAEKYGKDNITVTGHSLSGGIALHIAEENDV